MASEIYDVIVIGAGPTGLACAIEAERAGMRALAIDKGCLCNSLYHYPTNMQFFTTPERMEIGDLPMTIAGGKPNRTEALKYYRRAVEHYGVATRLYEHVDQVEGHEGAFIVRTHTEEDGKRHEHRAAKIIIATGYYDLPKRLGIPGEDLPHVSHYFTDPHPYWNQNVVVIGGKNSAAEAALDLFRGGAHVTLVHRHPELGTGIKFWVRPDIQNRIAAGEIRALFSTYVTRIEPHQVWVKSASQPENGREKLGHHEHGRQHDGQDKDGQQGEVAIPAVQVFAMTGYHPDFAFLERQGIKLDPVTFAPVCNPDTLETNVPGIYVAGVVVGGTRTSDIFIENGRFHGRQIVAAMAGKGRIEEPAPVAPPGE